MDLPVQEGTSVVHRLLCLFAAILCLWGRGSTGHAAALTHPDQACATCHQVIYETYEKTSMARGSGVAADGLIAGEFQHQPSGVHYSVYLSDGQAWLSYQRQAASAPLTGKQQLLYYIGSGHRGRTYLFQRQGLWFESPINYYARKSVWDMAPAYTQSPTVPLTLPVDPNCLHCHAGGVSASGPGARNRYEGAPFASAGVGCAACHGDPADHLRAEAAGKGVGVIVNPVRLGREERESTCLQCHLEGDAAIYKSGRSLASYRPGEKLSASVAYFVNTSRPNFGDRASSQYEAMLRSACRRAAGDRLTCTSCHDPHSSPTPGQRVAFYRGKCLACHTDATLAARHHPEQQDCAVCHMPTRDTQDISHEQLTDHDIERRPHANTAQLQLRSLEDGVTAKPAVLEVVGSARYSDRELGLAYAQLARKGERHAAEKATQLLLHVERDGTADAEVHTELGFLLQIAGNRAAAEKEYRSVLQQDESSLVAMSDLAVIYASTGRNDDAVRLLRLVIERDPSQTTAGMNLAFMECSLGRRADAVDVLQKIRVSNPDNAMLRQFLATGNYRGGKCELHQKVE